MTRAEVEAAFARTAHRRLRRAQDLVASGSRDARLYLLRELHVLGGEATFLGFAEVQALVGRAEALARAWDPVGGPAGDDALDMALAELACLLPPLPEATGPRPRRALIVADSVPHAWLLRDVLEHEGIDTAVVTDGAAAVDLVPDLVLCSLTSAEDLDAAVRAVRARSAAPLILVSAESPERLADEAARVRADGFVSTAAGLVTAVAAIREYAP